jgi:small-conductance mechanosensitive channel
MSLIVVLAIFISLGISHQLMAKAIYRLGESKAVSPYRLKYIVKTIGMALLLVHLAVLFAFLGIESSQVAFFLSSVTAVLGVVLFAQWSILSNITASMIIFFGFPYRVGDTIKVVDADEDITGVVEEITLFHVLIKKGENMITYPNSLILQKPVVKINKRTRAKKSIRTEEKEHSLSSN